MTIQYDDSNEPDHNASPTAHILDELQLHGYRPYQDDPDPRPLPEGNRIAGAVADIFDALVATLQDTRLEPDLEDLLWSTVNLFHRATDRVERELDGNEQAQRRSQREQDGSEVKSVELERLTAQGLTLIERRNSMELFRDLAAEAFERHVGSLWRLTIPHKFVALIESGVIQGVSTDSGGLDAGSCGNSHGGRWRFGAALAGDERCPAAGDFAGGCGDADGAQRQHGGAWQCVAA